jgi:hypothetical protein
MQTAAQAAAAQLLELAYPYLPLAGMRRCRRSLSGWPRHLDRLLRRRLLLRRQIPPQPPYGTCAVPECSLERILLLSDGIRWHPYCGLHRRLYYTCLGRRVPMHGQ